ncbi:hypothetical protein J7E24_07665 [Hymenobacter sp. ISL-91]|uniref:hypothetical protein n=1 Tax=Hymenobacter sp. ISL-91 TaxID=2819151 RepID=UPI001BE6182A|nr:hypothetical protein [Hymenobacter sp. ISL-91]MBT2557657.1 hypothetical protein [Hymenobacter sp. ISL-91]
MEDIKGFVWVIGAIVFFIWRMVQKAAEKAKEAADRQQAQQPGGAPVRRPAPSAPAVSFEELLAQMQRQNQQPAPPEPGPMAERAAPQEWEQQEQRIPEPQAKPARPAPAPRFGRGLEKTEVEQYSQELPAREARSLEAPKRAARLGSSLPRTSTEHGNDDFWSQKKISPKQTRRTVNELLQNPADIRAAFVLSEIFQRRY